MSLNINSTTHNREIMDISMDSFKKEFQRSNWKLIEHILQRNGGRSLLEHQLTSYDTFLKTQLEEIIQQFNPIKLHYDYVSK